MPTLIQAQFPHQTEPDSLLLLQQPHVLLPDVEDFWSDLAIALPCNRYDRGRGFAMSWHYAVVNAAILRPHLPLCIQPDTANIAMTIDWLTLNAGTERLVISHYVVRDSNNRLCVKIALIATSTLIIAKLRLMGDQIIMAHNDRLKRIGWPILPLRT